MAGVEDWRYNNLKERLDRMERDYQNRLNEIIQGASKRLDRMDAEIENNHREYVQSTGKINETIATLISDLKAVNTHIQNRLMWAVTGATVAASLLSGFAGHIFFK